MKLDEFGSKLKGFLSVLKTKTASITEKVLNLTKTSVFKEGDAKKRPILIAHKKVVNTKRFVGSIAAMAVLLIIMAYLILGNGAYAVQVNGVKVGVVRSKKAVDKAVLKIKQQYESINKAEVSFVDKIVYDKTKASNKQITDEKTLEVMLKNNMTMLVQCYGIYVNDSAVATARTKETAEEALVEIKNTYLKNASNNEYKEISFDEKVEVKAEFAALSRLMEKEEIVSFLVKGTNEIKEHEIQSGESFWTIAKRYNMSLESLIAANPDANPEKIKIGQRINLVVPKPLISVKTVEAAAYNDKVKYEQKVEFSDAMYKNESRVKVAGQYGEREVTAEITRINGIEKGRVILSEKILKAPKTEILVKGTKEVPVRKGTGSFTTPARGSLSSRFGMRWGRRHNGIDIAAPIGTPVKASDGGVVIFAGTDGAYGKLIKVDHGGGFVSYYGHLSKFYVKKGEKIFKGQKIGAVGNTGRSTGPHLHFEIRKNGTPQNPLKYIN